jgi:hypothetical protein
MLIKVTILLKDQSIPMCWNFDENFGFDLKNVELICQIWVNKFQPVFIIN